MMHALIKQVKCFLQSPEATASAFCSLGWDHTHKGHDHTFWCVVQYGLLEEMEVQVDVDESGWAIWMFLPPVSPFSMPLATKLAAAIEEAEPVFQVVWDEDDSVLVGAIGEGDVVEALRRLWAAWANPLVYEAVLTLCGLTRADNGYIMVADTDMDNPFDD